MDEFLECLIARQTALQEETLDPWWTVNLSARELANVLRRREMLVRDANRLSDEYDEEAEEVLDQLTELLCHIRDQVDKRLLKQAEALVALD
jgi:hypothetical protein